MWLEFEEQIKKIDKPTYFWWRDDDIRAQKFNLLKFDSFYRYRKKVRTLINLFDLYQIPAVFAVIPKNYLLYGDWFTNLFKTYHTNVIMHGLIHQNFASSGYWSEFPDEKNAEKDCQEILNYYKQFENIFGNLLLPYFCPPYNTINPKLEELLNLSGIKVTKANFGLQEKQNFHIDYDFCDWKIKRLKPYELILQEIIMLMKLPRNIIGINGHHACLNFSRGDFKFFTKLFDIMSNYSNIQ